MVSVPETVHAQVARSVAARGLSGWGSIQEQGLDLPLVLSWKAIVRQ